MTQLHNVKSQPLQTQSEASPQPTHLIAECWEEHEFLSKKYGWLYQFTLDLLQDADLAEVAFLSPIAYVSEVWSIIVRMDAEATSSTDVARILLQEFIQSFGDIAISNDKERIGSMADALWYAYKQWLRQKNSRTQTRAGALLRENGKRENSMRAMSMK